MLFVRCGWVSVFTRERANSFIYISTGDFTTGRKHIFFGVGKPAAAATAPLRSLCGSAAAPP